MSLRSRRPALAVIGTAAAIALLAGCAASTADEAAPTPTATPTVDAELAALVPEQFAGQTLKVGTGENNPPLYIRSTDGSLGGVAIEIAEGVGEKLGLDVEIIPTEFAATIPGLDSGQFGMIAFGASVTAERLEVVDMVTYFDVAYRLGVLADADEVGDEMDDLCGLTISVVAGSIQEQAVREQAAACDADGLGALTVLGLGDQAEAYLAVQSGQADATANGENSLLVLDDSWKVTGPSFAAAPAALMLKKDSGLGEAVVAAVNAMIEDGTYAAIFDKYGAVGQIAESQLNPAP